MKKRSTVTASICESLRVHGDRDYKRSKIRTVTKSHTVTTSTGVKRDKLDIHTRAKRTIASKRGGKKHARHNQHTATGMVSTTYSASRMPAMPNNIADLRYANRPPLDPPQYLKNRPQQTTE